MKKFYYIILWPILLSFPALVFAFSLSSSTFRDVIKEILSVIDILIPILFALAFIVFFWGLSKFILRSDNEKDIENGKNYMLWAVLALFVLLTFRVIITLVSTDLELGGNGNIVPDHILPEANVIDYNKSI